MNGAIPWLEGAALLWLSWVSIWHVAFRRGSEKANREAADSQAEALAQVRGENTRLRQDLVRMIAAEQERARRDAEMIGTEEVRGGGEDWESNHP